MHSSTLPRTLTHPPSPPPSSQNGALIAETIGQPVVPLAAKAAGSVVLGVETVFVGKKAAPPAAKGGKKGAGSKAGKTKLSKAERKAAAKAKKAAKAAGAATPPPAPAAAPAKKKGGAAKKGPNPADGVAVTITLVRPCIAFIADAALKRALRVNTAQLMCLKSMLSSRDHATFAKQVEASASGTVSISLREDKDAALKTFELTRGTHFFLSALERSQT